MSPRGGEPERKLHSGLWTCCLVPACAALPALVPSLESQEPHGAGPRERCQQVLPPTQRATLARCPSDARPRTPHPDGAWTAAFGSSWQVRDGGRVFCLVRVCSRRLGV